MKGYPTIKKCVSGQPRIGILSQRNINSLVSRCSIYEFEDIIYEIDDADILSPAPRLLSNGIISRNIRRLKRKLPGTYQAPIYEELQITQDYDVFIACCLFITDLRVLKFVKDWKQRSQKKICWIVELWENAVGKYEDLLEVLAEFDYVVLNWSGSVQALQEAIGKPVFYHVPGVDAVQFCPYPNPPVRCIDVFNMGRKSPVTHKALLEMSEEEGLFYLYDTFENMTTHHLEQHRSLSANLIKRSHYFIANAAKIDQPHVTKGQIEIGLRFVEGAAGGAIMIGVPPANAMFSIHFDWPDVVIPTTFDDPNISKLITDLNSNPARLARARRNNITHCLNQHDWAYRWKALLEIVGYEPMPGLLEREQYLQELTQLVNSEGVAE